MQNCIKCNRERETRKGIRKKVINKKTSEKGSKNHHYHLFEYLG